MTLRKLLANFTLYAVCLAFGGGGSAAETATAAARALVGGVPVDLDWLRTWKDRAPFACPCVSPDAAPVAPARTNH
jgi:hypothetical protein